MSADTALASVDRSPSALQTLAEQANAELENAPAGRIIEWAHATFGGGLVVSGKL